MAHEIKEHDKQQGRKQAWHGLTDVREDLTLDNCWLKDWDYAPQAVTVNGKETPFMVLGVSDEPELFIGRPYQKKTFKPVLNTVLIAQIAEAIKGQNLTLESCGTVLNRGRLFLSFGLAEAKFQAAGREFEAFLNIGNGNDMSSPLWVNTSNTCTVCNNTFTANLADKGLVMSVKKTQFSDFKLADMGRAIKAMITGQKAFAKALGTLAGLKCDDKTAREFFAGFLTVNPENPLSTRSEGIVERLTVLFKSGAGNDGNDFSDVFQAITDYYTHEAANAQGDAGANWKNWISSEFGAGKQSKIEGWEILTNDKTRASMVTMGRKVLKVTAQAARKAEAAK